MRSAAGAAGRRLRRSGRIRPAWRRGTVAAPIVGSTSAVATGAPDLCVPCVLTTSHNRCRRVRVESPGLGRDRGRSPLAGGGGHRHDRAVTAEPPAPETPSTELLASIELPDGAVVEVRPTTFDDASAIEELYASLDDVDVRRRFFTAFRPDEHWCQTWAAVGERGGYGVIAFERTHGARRPIGEAGYAMREDGDGDLAITVASDRRGWLGPYLLDTIVRHARESGLENLQAEALAENSSMLSMMRHRGGAILEHEDGVVRMTIATDGFVPSWPPLDERPRVLVEVGGGRWSAEAAVLDAGLAVAMCTGPDRRRRGVCPALGGESCPLVDGADAVVVLLDPAAPSTAALVSAHRARYPDRPIFVRRAGLDDEGVEVLDQETAACVARLVAAVRTGD